MNAKRFAVLLALLVLWSGCGPAWGPRISIHWRKPKPEVKVGTVLKYQESVTVGIVKKVEPDGRGTMVHARLLRKYAHYVKDETTFLVKKDPPGSGVYIEVRPLRSDARGVRDRAVFTGAESDLEADITNVLTDWKRTLILAGGGIVFVLLFFLIIKNLLRFWLWILSLVAGVAAAIYFSPYLDPYIRAMAPPNVRADLVAYVVAFFGGFLIANIVFGILLRPLKSRR